MKERRRLIAVLLAMVICISLLAACGGDSSKPGSSGDTSPGSSGDTTTSGGGSTTTTDNNTNSGGAASPSTSKDYEDTALTVGRTPANEAAAPLPAPTGANVKFADTIDIIIDNTSVASLDPYRGGGPAQMWSFNLMFDRLLYYMGSGNYAPSLATEWHTDDYKTFTFKLREDVVFHNGEPLKASDVVFTCEYGMNPEHSTNATWGLIESVKALGEYEVEIVLKAVGVDFPYRISQGNIAIVNEKALKDDPINGMLIGTGAYRLDEFVENNYWTFTRNDNYWSDLAITRKIIMRYVPEISSRTIMMMNGDSQLCLKVNPDDMELFVGNPDFWIDDHMVNNPTPMHFNVTDPLLSDINLRLALASAMDREEIALVAGGDYYMPAYEDGGAWGYSTEFRNRDIPLIPEDMDAAKAYLEKSSYNGETIEICATNMVTTARAAEVLQQQFSKLGVNTEVRLMEGVAMNEYTQWGNNKSQIILTPIAFSANAAAFRNAMYPRATGNRASFEDPRLTEILDQALVELDYTKRGELYYEAQEIIAEGVPYVNMWYLLQTVVAVKGIGGFNFPGDNLYDFRYIYWQIEG